MNSSFLYLAFGLYRQECTRAEYKGNTIIAVSLHKTFFGFRVQNYNTHAPCVRFLKKCLHVKERCCIFA
jgi:hypothetical protein